MSKYFGWINGEPFDFHFKPYGDGVFTRVYLGEHLICDVSNEKRKGWAVIVQGKLSDQIPRLVEGFKSRYSAIEYALKVHPLTSSKYNQ